MSVKSLSLGLIFLMAISSMVANAGNHSNQKELNIGTGFLVPADSRTGWQFHISEMWKFDNVIGYGVGTDVYFTNFTNRTLIASSSNPTGLSSTYEQEASYSRIMFSPRFLLEVTPGDPQRFWRLMFRIAVGPDLLFSSERVFNDSTDAKDNRLYFGVGGEIDAGVNLKLSGYTSLKPFIGYHWGTTKRTGASEANLPISEEVVMHGFRLGLALTFTL